MAFRCPASCSSSTVSATVSPSSRVPFLSTVSEHTTRAIFPRSFSASTLPLTILSAFTASIVVRPQRATRASSSAAMSRTAQTSSRRLTLHRFIGCCVIPPASSLLGPTWRPFSQRSMIVSTAFLHAQVISPVRTHPQPHKRPNQALQRTAAAVTLAAPPPSPAQPSRQPPPSLSLGSLGYFRKTSQRNNPLLPAERTCHN